MSGNTLTHNVAEAGGQTGTTRTASVTRHRAARELGLRRGDFDLAVQLGRVRTVPDDGGGGRRVPRDEIDRIRAADGFPDVLRAAVRTVGTREGAALMDVTTARFTRLARLGLLVPVKFYLNRYRAVVWLYLAEELRRFRADERNTALLKGRTPEGLRDQLGGGLDLRPRNWRGRHLGFLLRQADDPWARAAAVASLLDAAEIAAVVTDPYERSHLRRFRPALATHGSPGSPAAQLAEEIATAADPDEVDRLRSELAAAVDTARRHRPAPRPGTLVAPHPPGPQSLTRGTAEPVPREAEDTPPSEAEQQPRRLSSLLGRLWRRDS
ncbi:hypothetical protein B9W62_33730 [Streptomyces sp. CS113]|uniref:DUF6397 family protein n=1 Tax=Streptomyces sp. CS113 TaxID=1982761 RepID=UPI000B41E985|nr:DUF6397 family protein [Streptomyces sp. CS113]OWA00634.1 hypothetical protein B9W62_33730 [Streptomyces sp. CS113]